MHFSAAARTSSKPIPLVGVEVDAELVGVLGVGGQIRPQVQAEAAEVDGPHDVGDVGDDQRVGGRAVRGRDDGRLQPVGGARRDPLLEEGLAGGAVGEALQQGGSAAGGVEEVLADLEVVRDEVELRGVDGREVHLVGPADPDLVPVDLHDALIVSGHKVDSSDGWVRAAPEAGRGSRLVEVVAAPSAR